MKGQAGAERQGTAILTACHSPTPVQAFPWPQTWHLLVRGQVRDEAARHGVWKGELSRKGLDFF